MRQHAYHLPINDSRAFQRAAECRIYSTEACMARGNPPTLVGGGLGAPSMGAILEVKVLPQADHSERSEAQLHKGDHVWGGSV